MHMPRTTFRSLGISTIIIALCVLLAGCDAGLSSLGNTSSSGTIGSGVQGVSVFVEPSAGDRGITSAIVSAQKSVWVEMYLLSDRNIIRALEEAAHKGIDVRVMLEMHPFGGGGSPRKTLDLLKAAGAQAQPTAPSFALTHEKGMIIDSSTAYIMTSNFTRAALGGTSGGSSGTTNREYDIVDSNPQDVQAVIAIFNADWNHTTAQFNNSNLVVSPVNSRNTFTSLIASAHSTLLIEGEEMKDTGIEQALVDAAKRGIHIQIILPSPRNSPSDSNSQGIDTIKQGGIQVKEDPRLYMHAKIIVVDGQRAFVGSENISAQSLDQNRELGIVVADGGVLNTLQQTFQQDWSDSQSV
ncbi:MAG: phospholipase D-like domain-containing protein [Ktedonobacteraceae bacterium]